MISDKYKVEKNEYVYKVEKLNRDVVIFYRKK